MKPDIATDGAAVRDAVATLLASGHLSRSPALSELLEFLGKRWEAAQTDPTTEYVIAQDLLGRDGSFDPKNDTAVRVRMKRLRDALESFYQDNPQPARLAIPGRSYDLVLHRTRKRTGFRHVRELTFVGVPVVMAVALLSAWLLYPAKQESYPLIRIFPIQNLTNDATAAIFEEGLQRQIATDLQRFGRVRVFVASPPERDIEGAAFTLRGSILSVEDGMDIAIRLERESDNKLIFGNRISGQILDANYFQSLSAISAQISGQIAGQGGPMTQLGEDALEVSVAGLFGRSGVKQDVFQCLIHTDRFFDDYNTDTFIDAYRCFDAAASAVEEDPLAYSRLGTLVMHAVPDFDLMDTAALPEGMIATPDEALEIANDAVRRFPSSSDAYLLLGAVQNVMGDRTKARISLLQSISLNPGDPVARAVLAYLLMAEEEFDAAIRTAEEAIRLSASPQGYIYLPMVLSALALGDENTAIEAGTTYAAKRSGDGALVIRLMVARLQGDTDIAAHLSRVVAEMTNPLAGFSGFVQGETLRAAMQEHLPEIDFSKL